MRRFGMDEDLRSTFTNQAHIMRLEMVDGLLQVVDGHGHRMDTFTPAFKCFTHR